MTPEDSVRLTYEARITIKIWRSHSPDFIQTSAGRR
jgi:hypothetical protein